jgi:hypothetical protein
LSGPDEALRLWWRLTAREENASGRDPFLIKGSVAAVACGSCGSDRHHEVPAKKGRGVVDRCRHCGSIWQFRIEYVVRGTVQVSRRPQELERRLVALGDLEHCIDQLPDVDGLLYGLYLVTDRSYEYVAELASVLSLENPHQWPQPMGGFTLKRVRGAVGRARRLLREALAARGLIARRVPVLMLDGGREALDALEPLPFAVVVPADPHRWVGLLEDFAGTRCVPRGPPLVAYLARGTTRELGVVYREMPWHGVTA